MPLIKVPKSDVLVEIVHDQQKYPDLLLLKMKRGSICDIRIAGKTVTQKLEIPCVSDVDRTKEKIEVNIHSEHLRGDSSVFSLSV